MTTSSTHCKLCKRVFEREQGRFESYRLHRGMLNIRVDLHVFRHLLAGECPDGFNRNRSLFELLGVLIMDLLMLVPFAVINLLALIVWLITLPIWWIHEGVGG